MQKKIFIYLLFFGVLSVNAQKILPSRKGAIKIDTVKTEVIEITTKYNPEIADASKINKNPTIELLEKSKKKKLNYTIFSAPVASTFKPKSGVLKGIDVGVRERIYDNYIATGYGNFSSPYVEAYFNKTTRFDSEFGLSAKYAASFDNIENTLLDSDFSNLEANLFYKQEERYFDWKVNLNAQRNTYNWYGLQENTFAPNVISNIDENQTYNYFKLSGEIDFLDAYLDDANLGVSYFSDAFDSNEIQINLNTNFDFPLDFLNSSFNNLQVKTGLEFLNGKFDNDYVSQNALDYSIFTANINPEYNTTFSGFALQLGFKIFGSFDTENDKTNILAYPDLKIEKAIIKKYLNLFAGVSGGLDTNSYKRFTEENPFVSPTLFITQTSTKYNAFVGFRGNLTNDINFTLSANVKEEEDKPLFVKNNSKSNGVNSVSNGIPFKGYEYGNSFNVVYDDVKTVSIFAETIYDLSKNIELGLNINFDNYTTTNQTEAWNLPTLQTTFIGKYKSEKWYATTNVFYVGERKDILYSGVFPSNIIGIQNINSFVDVNLNGGYHFNNQFSAFVKLNNILNSDYQRFADFNVQGFQVLGGITYKFDF